MHHIPIGLNLSSIGVSADWWLAAAQRMEEAGFGSAWIWWPTMLGHIVL